MKYIPGFEFIAGVSTSTHKTPSVLKQKQTKAVTDESFIAGKRYKLYYIKPANEVFIYTFRREDGQLIDIEFESVSDAETRIGKLIGA